MNTSIFERIEQKYIVADAGKSALLRAAGDRLREDEYSRSTVISVYFDTCDRRVIRRSLDKPEFKQKLRLRSYGTPGPDSTVFLELKKKYNGIVYKRREAMTLSEAESFIAGGPLPRDTQIMRELAWEIDSGELAPAAVISSRRLALSGDDGLRVTFDQNILCRTEDLLLEHGPYGRPVTGAGENIMEIKSIKAMPLWLADALDELKIYPKSFSKYGTAFQKYMLEDCICSIRSFRPSLPTLSPSRATWFAH